MEQKHITWWDSLPDQDKGILKDMYGISALANDREIFRIWRSQGQPSPQTSTTIMDAMNVYFDSMKGKETKGTPNTQQRKEGEEMDFIVKVGITTYHLSKNQDKLFINGQWQQVEISAPTLKKENEELKAENKRLQDINRELLEWLEKANNNGRELLENYANGHRDGNEWKSFAGAVCEVYETYKNKK